MRDMGHEVLVIERGYIGDRFKYSSLGWNGLNGHAVFPPYSGNGKRFESHGGTIKPWKNQKGYALIMGQVPTDMSLGGLNIMPWYEDMAYGIKDIHGLDVYFRPHPDLVKKGYFEKPKGCILSEHGSLIEALDGAAFSVCWNSNSSVDSVLNGTPCIVGNKGSMAWDMCGESLTEILTPEREQWAQDLAWKQWSLDEIQSGYALEGIVCQLGQS